MEGWQGAGVADTTLFHSAPASLRWELAKGDTVTWNRPAPEAARRGMLSFRVHSERMTAAKVTLSVLAPDAENAYQATFSVEWTGWNHVQLEKTAFRAVGEPAWDRVQGLRFTAVEGAAPPTVLRLDDFTWSDESPTWGIGGGEVLIEPFYNGLFSPMERWRPAEGSPAEGHRLTRRWNALALERRRDPTRPAAVTYVRPFNLDLTGIQAIRIQAALPRDATLGMSARIDGEVREICPPRNGADNWSEYRGAVRGRRLEALYLHCGDDPAQVKAGSPAQVEYHFHFATAEKEGFRPPEYPKARPVRPLTGELKARAPLLEGGIPSWMYFGREDVPALRAKIRSGAPAEMFRQLRERADSYLGYDPEPFIGDTYPVAGHEWLRPWTPSERWSEIAETCAFTYVLTDDLRYAEQAKRVLLAMARTTHWSYGMIARHPVGWGGHGGTFCEASCGVPATFAYNWIYNTLTDEERHAVEEAILWKGWFWLNDYIDTRGYIRAMNQGPWFNFGALAQAAALAHRYPWLREFYPKYEANFKESIGLCYFRDGANTEGAAYWGATTNFVARALPLLAHVLGKDVREYAPEPLQKSIDLPIYMRSMVSADWYVLGVNDGNYTVWNPGHIGLFFAGVLDLPRAQWAWQETAGKTKSYGDLVMSLIWHRDWGEAPRPELALAKHFRGVDWAILRSGWNEGDILFALQSGIWGRGHQHHDKNHFELEAYGERLCPDKGVPAYGDPRGPYFQHTVSHNTLTINGANQAGGTAKILRFEHSDARDLVVSDATGNYPGARKMVRHVLFVRPRYFVIADQAATRKPSSIEYNLHTLGDISVDGDRIRFSGQKADLLVKMVSPALFTHRLGQTQRGPNEAPIRDLQLAPPRPVSEVLYLAVLYPVRKGDPEPEIRCERTPEGAAIHVLSGGREDVIRWRDGKGFEEGVAR